MSVEYSLAELKQGSYTANDILNGKLPLNSEFSFEEPVELILTVD